MLRIAVCDDEPADRLQIRQFLEGYLKKSAYAYTITEYSAGEPLTDDYADGDAFFNIVFLDIFMGRTSGIETARQIRRHDRRVSIVFLTTTPNYALESYDVRAYGYLLKPLNEERAETLLTEFLQEEYSGRQKSLMVHNGGRGGRIAYCDIEYAESDRNRILIHLEQGDVHHIYAKLDDVESELKPFGFLRCHQSFIVNMEKVHTAQKDFIMKSGAQVPIRQRGAKAIRDSYFEYILSQTDRTRI